MWSEALLHSATLPTPLTLTHSRLLVSHCGVVTRMDGSPAVSTLIKSNNNDDNNNNFPQLHCERSFRSFDKQTWRTWREGKWNDLWKTEFLIRIRHNFGEKHFDGDCPNSDDGGHPLAHSTTHTPRPRKFNGRRRIIRLAGIACCFSHVHCRRY